MSTGILAPEKMNQTDTGEAAFVATSGPETQENSGLPAWFRESQTEAWKNFQSLPMPQRTDEAWRFASLKSIDIARFVAPQPVSDADQAALIERSIGLKETAGRMIFANARLLQREVLSDDLKRKGVIWEPIERAVVEHAEIFRKHFMTQDVVLGSKKFAALHKAWVKSGTFLYIPRGVEIELPIEIFHWLHGADSSTFPHTLLVAGENSKVTLVDYFESADAQAPGFACGVNDLFLEAGAKLTYICVQNWSRDVLSFQINSTAVGRDASAKMMNLNLGSRFARTESVSSLLGHGGRSDMLSVSVAEGAQEFDQRTLQDHRVANTASDLLYKNSLDDTARTILAGLIRVEPGAHKTDAYQKVRNLLLSDEAEANSAPGLEIEADDVRCTHGATSGQIDDEELFYMLSRGISAGVAKRLIVAGFLNEVADRLGNKAIAEKVSDLIAAKFGAR
jgi:Fe-S cluster assembly protein SufD